MQEPQQQLSNPATAFKSPSWNSSEFSFQPVTHHLHLSNSIKTSITKFLLEYKNGLIESSCSLLCANHTDLGCGVFQVKARPLISLLF